MSVLDKAIEGVPPVTPPAGQPPVIPPSPGDKADGKGRGPDEVRGELIRKMEESNAALRAELAGLKGMVEGAVAARPAVPAGPKNLDEMSIAELRTMRTQIPAEQSQALVALDELISNRMMDERISAGVDKKLGTQKFNQLEKDANEAAMARWPELRDKTSRLYVMTNRLLDEMGNLAETDPRAVLNAANEAGLGLGLTPKTHGPRPVYDRGGMLAHGRDQYAPGPGDASAKLSPEEEAELDKISRRLGEAMPGGKFTAEQMVRIREGKLAYKANAHLLTNG